MISWSEKKCATQWRHMYDGFMVPQASLLSAAVGQRLSWTCGELHQTRIVIAHDPGLHSDVL